MIDLIPAVAIALTLAGEQSPPQSPVQPFKSSVDVVRVDVSALDGNGRPIPDLTAEDFELRVDGRRRPIVSAQFLAVPSDSNTPHAPDPDHYSSNAQAVGGRLIMIAVDRTSIAFGRAKAALEAASRFVGSLNRADRVALATIPEGPQVNFTADHALVQRLLLKIEGTAVSNLGRRNIGIADALEFDRRNDSAIAMITERECGVPNLGGNQRSGSSEVLVCQNDVKSEALLVASDARARARQSIAGLQGLLEGFPPSQTPKILAYISEGLVTQGEPSQLPWLDDKAAAAHVTIYPLLLEGSEFDASQSRPPANRLADRAVQEQGLAILAQATGGDLFRMISNSDSAFQRLSAELSGYYLLGFEPDARDRSGRPHAISVDVRRRGVTVRSRRQFTIPTTTVKTAETEVIATLRDPLPAVEIPIKFTTYSFRGPRQEKMRLFLAAEIDRSINPEGQFSVGYVVVDFDGKLVASQMGMALPSPDPRHKRTQRYFTDVSVDPGKYTVKLVVVDDAARRGSVERVAEAGLTQAGPIRATNLLLGGRGDGGWALPVAPAITGDITGDALYGYVELFADAAETLTEASVTLEIAASETSAALERVPVQLEVPNEDARCRMGPVRVSVGSLPPGDYVARAVIAVRLDAVGQVSRPFRIARAAAGR